MSDSGEFTPIFKLGLKRADPAELVMGDELLRASPLVKALGDEAARRLLKASVTRRFPDKAVVFRQGDAGDGLMLVLNGEARLFATCGSDAFEAGAARKGEVFGEGEVLDGTGVRQMSAVAAGDLDVIELPRALLFELSAGRPELERYLEELRERRNKELEEMAAFLNRW